VNIFDAIYVNSPEAYLEAEIILKTAFAEYGITPAVKAEYFQ
jgi:hypothetical protein